MGGIPYNHILLNEGGRLWHSYIVNEFIPGIYCPPEPTDAYPTCGM